LYKAKHAKIKKGKKAVWVTNKQAQVSLEQRPK